MTRRARLFVIKKTEEEGGEVKGVFIHNDHVSLIIIKKI